jgi:hypothetical protein
MGINTGNNYFKDYPVFEENPPLTSAGAIRKPANNSRTKKGVDDVKENYRRFVGIAAAGGSPGLVG